ncbi:enoyl-CoA hydratase/isomerase family protein [Streptomyces sp. NBC_01343]|uniref:(3,5-dihydroxyphenyl)acetyl-CoA 1,2-dioxygenase DpgC n=1 Tax=Streptomyces sp. NBC_01343 TaxID=2903832 RepID=UPI002E14A10A|nr:enoyl-CoA hydratase/isomerase family protein [Streptomyces sp. NBC_01343]
MTVAAPLDTTPAPTGRVPAYSGDLTADARLLTDFTAPREEQLAALPAKRDRAADQQRLAEGLLAACREARRCFLARHTEAVYDVLTDGRTRLVRLADLVFAAADRFPGLTPTRAAMAAEDACIQAEKDGREIDQALFCHAVLDSPVTGRHLIDAMLAPTPRALDLLAAFRATDRVELDTVLLERRGHTAHVTFRNADCLNAEDNRLISELETAVDLVLLDDRIRVGVLRGGRVNHPRYAGRRVFSAGINLKDLRNGDISFVDFLLGRELGYINKMYRGLLTAPERAAWAERTVQKPWIGAVDTFAIGGGMQLLLVLDHVIAADDAYVSLPAAEEGIVPGLGNLRLSRLTGARAARQVLLGGRRIAMAEPEARLVCDEVVPAGAVDEAVERAAEHLAAPAVAANRRMLALVEEPLDLFRGYLAEFALVQADRSYSEDVLAKVERRWSRSQARG